MIHIAIGTKAQFIKMAPVMQRLKERGIKFNLIDLGQHSLITSELRKEFELDGPSVVLSKGENASSILKIFMWLKDVLFKSLSYKRIRKEIFLDTSGVCLIHGEPLSSLIALYLAKRAKLKVAHIESGLFSFNYFNPFPEEIIRNLIVRWSDILFAPSSWAFENLRKIGCEKKSVLLSANTSFEATAYTLSKGSELKLDFEKYVLVTFHRAENIFRKKRLKLLIGLIREVAKRFPVIFIQDPPTVNLLKRFHLNEEIDKLDNINCLSVVSHSEFLHLLKNCEFIISDGGSIQEESFYLDKPCLLMRNHTERMEGLGENVVLSKFSPEEISIFLDNYKNFKRKTPQDAKCRPSQEIVDYILAKQY
ncbi:MAG: UDP-N-acetylglucosamine 2-epimerase [Candidatus Omnitrophica bacterium]|nr:UDP-N-acetylglucosamine 2-epimerase [Candidatus Omnitrophota bacterium]